MDANPFRTLLRSGKIVRGIFNFIPSEIVVDIIGHAGMDYVIFDTEHASYDIGYIERGVRAAEAAGLVPVARVSNADPYLIARVLDTGITGLMFARVSGYEDATNIVRFCRLAPLGERGACPGSRAGHYRLMPDEEYTRLSNDIAITIMIETKSGLDAVEQILRVPGIDGVAVGRSDLARSLGLLSADDAACLAAEEHVNSVANSLGLSTIVAVRAAEQLRAYADKDDGPRVFFYTTDAYQMGSHLRSLVAQSRGDGERQAG